LVGVYDLGPCENSSRLGWPLEGERVRIIRTHAHMAWADDSTGPLGSVPV